jgi:hypothetical protein
MYLNNEKKEIINNYINKSLINKLLYLGRGLNIAEGFTAYINADYNNGNHKYNELTSVLWKQDTKHIKDIFEGKEYGALRLLLGDTYAKVFKNVWDRAALYIYSTGYDRRSYRTNKSTELYLGRNIEKLKECVYLAAMDFSLDKYFADNKSKYEDIAIISDIIAIELDNNNPGVFEKIKEIVYNDNNISIVTREIIRGLLMSRNEEAHRIIGELLLAAKLQEGLRQAIVESMDECSKEAFIYILKIIIDNNLTRFSSVARAFGTWTGLALDIERPKVIKKCFDAAYNCLTNEVYRNECMDSNDNLLIYIGIWSIAFDEVEDIDQILIKLTNSTEKYKKLVALQFLYDTQFMMFRHEIACNITKVSDLEVVALVIKNLFGNLNAYNIEHNLDALKSYHKLNDNCHGIKLFNQLKNIVDIMPKKEIEFKGSVFPWVDFKLTTAEIMEKMILSVGLDYDAESVDILIDYKEKMSADTRQAFVESFLKQPKNGKQKNALIEFLGDRSSSVRQSAFKIVSKLSLSNEDYRIIENLLQYKSGDLRKNAIKMLLKQNNEGLVECVQRLTSSNNENKRLAAIDIVSGIKGTKEQKDIYEQCLSCITSISDASEKERMLTKNIVKDAKELKTFENGFGLYDKARDYQVDPIEKPKEFNIKSLFSMTANEVNDILNNLSNIIHDNRDFEYEVIQWDDTKTTITLGGSNYLQSFTKDNRCLDNYPLADKMRDFAKQNSLQSIKLIELNFYLGIIHRLRYDSYLSWYEKLLEKNFNINMAKELLKTIEKIPYYNIITEYIKLLVNEIPTNERFDIAKKVSEYLYIIIPSDKHYEDYLKKNNSFYYYSNRKDSIAVSYEIDYWLKLMAENITDDESFVKFFTVSYNYYKAGQYANHGTLTLSHFGRALESGLIDDNEIYKELMTRVTSPEDIRTITNLDRHDRNNLRSLTNLIEMGNKAVDTIASIEVTRGELNTEVTHLAVEIKKCYGIEIFIAIILGLEKDTYVRGYNFVSGDCTKKQILSHLLKCCYPKNGEDANTLVEYLKGKKISDKQLIEAAMYSPQWLDIVAQYLDYDGLKSVCWYFHAHVNEYFSEEKAAIIARFSPISTEDLKDGAFDQQWFKEAYNTIGEKKFKLVYDSAKYIAGGGLHKRSQLFADATLGKLGVEEVKNRVMDKRNKEYLLTYSLIPVKNKEDVLQRYEYIHQYIKESKKFGAQRQSSEGRSASIALLNLARNAGYSDVNRLTWNMETAKIDSIRPYLEPYKVEDIQLQLVIDELGQADIVCTKDGKILKSIPTKFKKHEYVKEIKVLKKSLKNQYVRAKRSFEASMENGDEFKGSELISLCANPVLAPIIKTLVFKSLDKLGYINEGYLIDYKNESYKLNPEDNVIIAHPVHLYEAGCWSNYQKDIFLKKTVQPFKQVFRELYLPNADELKEQTKSRRYAGHQIQPKKTMALLKTRGWMASNEEGLQKVYYKENIIATIYAIADWFSPADIEAPTIEFVRFEDRKTYMPVSIDKIPKLIFSEIMRDLDLVVSVAHVGGVDPEASLSTVEIRSVIVDELLKLLKLQNVVLKGNHAHITGVHGEYTVHLGSGTVHKMGTGSINILPVHSSHRGRIFLPFIDQDPKSAEIISKIILLAEDKKLKDPSILSQIVN